MTMHPNHVTPRACAGRRVRSIRRATLTAAAGLIWLAAGPAGACAEHMPGVRNLRLLPDFSGEERQHGDTYSLSYGVNLSISAADLSRYAEARAFQLCGGGSFRYLSLLEYPRSAAQAKEAFERRIDVVVDCQRD